LHVVLLSHEYPPFIIGGVGTFVDNLAHGLLKQGLEVTVIAGYPVPSGGLKEFKAGVEQTDSGINVIRFPYANISPRQLWFQIFNLQKLYQVIKRINADVIHGQSSSAFPVSYVLKDLAPLAVTFHTSPKVEKTLIASSLFRGGSWSDFKTYLVGYPVWSFTFKKELDYSTTAVAVSNALKSDLLSEMGESYGKKIQCIHNGVDIETLEKEYESEISLEESTNTILFAGRLFWRKGPLNIIKMAYLLQKNKARFKIIVHGTGPLFNKMQEYIDSLRLRNIELRGFTSKQQLMKSLRLCKFVAIPSMYEACPMILLESMCLGKIPLMLNLPFSSELTEGGKYGILADGVESLTDELITLENSHSLNQLSNSIRMFARSAYNMDKVAAKYVEMYREVSS